MATDFSLGKQVGPLPLGAWIGIVVGGLGIGYLINQSQSKQVAVPLVDQGVGAGMQQLIETPPINVSPSTPELDNAAWGRNAVNWLVSQNHDQGVADNAVRKYLQAQPLTAQEQAMLNLVLVRFGAPPEPLPPVDQPPTTPPPVTPPAVGAPSVRITSHSPLRIPKGFFPGGIWVRGVVKDGTSFAIGKAVQVNVSRKPPAFSVLGYVATNSRGEFIWRWPGFPATSRVGFNYRGARAALTFTTV